METGDRILKKLFFSAMASKCQIDIIFVEQNF